MPQCSLEPYAKSLPVCHLAPSIPPCAQSVDAASELCELFRDYGGRPDLKDQVALETMQELAAKVRQGNSGRSKAVQTRQSCGTRACFLHA